MNLNLDSIKVVVPVFVAGVVMMALTSPILEENGHFDYQPNPGALAQSPFGRTVGLALQGPVTRFWDRGVGSIEKEQKLSTGGRVDQRLFNHVSSLRNAKTNGQTPAELGDQYQDFAMAKIEKKLSLAWKMDPRNFSNYAIYQMFLWEGFNNGLIESEMKVRELSLRTLEVSLDDEQSPMSLLTAGQAAYDLVFAARTDDDQDYEEATRDVDTYSKMIPEILNEYDEMVAEMQRNGRWDLYSEVKKSEFEQRKRYLEHLNSQARRMVEQLTQSEEPTTEGRNS